jgi:hypothetical protein
MAEGERHLIFRPGTFRLVDLRIFWLFLHFDLSVVFILFFVENGSHSIYHSTAANLGKVLDIKSE